METRLEYWNRNYTNYQSEITSYETLSGTKEEVFNQFYDKNNRLRYCNGSYYEFEDKSLQSEYRKWLESLSESTRFQMYYGNGVVD